MGGCWWQHARHSVVGQDSRIVNEFAVHASFHPPPFFFSTPVARSWFIPCQRKQQLTSILRCFLEWSDQSVNSVQMMAQTKRSLFAWQLQCPTMPTSMWNSRQSKAFKVWTIHPTVLTWLYASFGYSLYSKTCWPNEVSLHPRLDENRKFRALCLGSFWPPECIWVLV